MIPETVHLNIGSLLFEGLDQIDLTGPFEVLSRLPNATHRIYAKSMDPVRDVMGLRIMPDATLAEAPQLHILHVPGGPGQALMEDEEVLGWLRSQAKGAKKVLSVCTGALLFGGASLIRGKRATTHWASFHLLPWFGAVPVDDRVVVDGNWIFAAGATSGSTQPFDSPPRCAASRPPTSSSLRSLTRQSRLFRAAHLTRRLQRSWRGGVEIRPS
jgi:cyclohexyl-isocyanide hydratase